MAKSDSVFGPLIKASIVGIQLVVATFVGLAIGHFLDKAFGTKPWLTFIFLFLGIFTGFRDMFRTVRRAMEAAGPDDEQPGSPGYEDKDKESGGSDGTL